MAISFPSNPTTNQVYTSGGKSWTFDGTVWSQTAAATYATIPDNAVVTASISDGAVTTVKINDNAVTTVKINDGAVTAAKLAAGAAVPSQTGQSGKYLTTDGTTASWGALTSGLTKAQSVGYNLVFGG